MKSLVEIINSKIGKVEGKNAAAVLDGVLNPKNSTVANSSSSKNELPYPPQAKVSAFPVGEVNKFAGDHFSGKSFLSSLTPANSPLSVWNVTFEPGCINNWHIHKATSGGGQVLVCVGGRGWYQEEGKPAQALKPGDVVTIPANVKHWHGAAKDSWFAHLALEVPGENTSTEWLERLSDAEYNKLK